MGTFDIIEARQELGFTPTTNVRANIDVRTGAGEVGAAIGQGILQFGLKLDLIQADTQFSEANRGISEVLNTINDRVRSLEDTSPEGITALQQDIESQITALRPKNRRAARFFDRRVNQVIPQSDELIANSLDAKLKANWTALNTALLNDISITGDPSDYLVSLEKGKKLNIPGFNNDTLLEPLRQAGVAKAVQFSVINATTAASAGDLAAANALLESGRTTASQNATLSRAVNAGNKELEKQRVSTEQQRVLDIVKGLPNEDAFSIIDQSDLSFNEKKSVRAEHTTRENIRNEQIKEERQKQENEARDEFVTRAINPEENRVQFKSDIDIALAREQITTATHTALSNIATTPIPQHSDAVASSIARRATTQVGQAVLTFDQGMDRIIEVLPQLDANDRTNVLANLEKTFAVAQESALEDAYQDGRSLMSPEFLGIDSFSALQILTKGKTDKEKAKINRRFRTEFNNRDLYERAMTQWFRKESAERTVPIPEIEQQALSMLLTYQNRLQLTIPQLEAEVRKGQQEILLPRDENAIARPEEAKPLKAIKDMTREEKLAELERIRNR